MRSAELTEDEFDATYAPEQDEYGGLYVQRYYSEDADRLLLERARTERRLWTVVAGDDNGRTWYVVNGFHFVNRLYHIMTSRPYEAGVEIEVKWPWIEDPHFRVQ